MSKLLPVRYKYLLSSVSDKRELDIINNIDRLYIIISSGNASIENVTEYKSLLSDILYIIVVHFYKVLITDTKNILNSKERDQDKVVSDNYCFFSNNNTRNVSIIDDCGLSDEEKTRETNEILELYKLNDYKYFLVLGDITINAKSERVKSFLYFTNQLKTIDLKIKKNKINNK